jgi:hypothetical protein
MEAQQATRNILDRVLDMIGVVDHLGSDPPEIPILHDGAAQFERIVDRVAPYAFRQFWGPHAETIAARPDIAARVDKRAINRSNDESLATIRGRAEEDAAEKSLDFERDPTRPGTYRLASEEQDALAGRFLSSEAPEPRPGQREAAQQEAEGTRNMLEDAIARPPVEQADAIEAQGPPPGVPKPPRITDQILCAFGIGPRAGEVGTSRFMNALQKAWMTPLNVARYFGGASLQKFQAFAGKVEDRSAIIKDLVDMIR